MRLTIDELIIDLNVYLTKVLRIPQVVKLVYVKTFLSEGLVNSGPTSKNETPF